MELQDKNAFNESVAFSAGVGHERSRIVRIIRQRLDLLKMMDFRPIKPEVVRNLTGELERLIETVEKEG